MLSSEANETETDGSDFLWNIDRLKKKKFGKKKKYIWGLAKLKTFEKQYETLEEH